VTWRAHRCRQSLSADSNLEWFFDCEIVAQIFERAVVLSPDDFARTDTVRVFHLQRFQILLPPVEICHLYISPGHNFVGHHGREPDTHPMIEVPMIECAAGRGIRGDRYFDFKNDYKGQVTFFSLEVFNELCDALQIQDCSRTLVRRNVITRGVDLNKLIGQDFEIQDVHFHGMEECRPCYWMNRVIAPGAEEFLKGRGGLRAKILSDGQLRSNMRLLEQIG